MSGRIAWLKRLSTLYRLVAPHCLRAFFRHRPFAFEIYGFILFNFARSQPAFAHFSTLKPDNLLRKKKDSQIIFKKKSSVFFNLSNPFDIYLCLTKKKHYNRVIRYKKKFYIKHHHLEDSHGAISFVMNRIIWIIEIN